jgi:3-deoxy-D-manno-octulosonate 8-phosphate phosphatase KdsC-like HAD superfamily phosphatase
MISEQYSNRIKKLSGIINESKQDIIRNKIGLPSSIASYLEREYGKYSIWIANNFKQEETALVVDSFTDIPSLVNVTRSFAPRNAHPELLKRVSDVLNAAGGGGAVAEVLDILMYEKFQKHLWDI